MTPADRLALLRAAHRRYLARERTVDRIAARVEAHTAPSPEWDIDAIDDLAGASVAERVRWEIAS